MQLLTSTLLIPWGQQSSELLTTVALFSALILEPALVKLSPNNFVITVVCICFCGLNFLCFIGLYVANRASDKITQLTDNVYICRSGSVSVLLLKFWILMIFFYIIIVVCFKSNAQTVELMAFGILIKL